MSRHEVGLALAGKEFRRARLLQRDRAGRLYTAIVYAVENGMTESEAARIAGVDRMTVRRALGKR